VNSRHYVRMIASIASFKCLANLGHAVTNRAKSWSEIFCESPCESGLASGWCSKLESKVRILFCPFFCHQVVRMQRTGSLSSAAWTKLGPFGGGWPAGSLDAASPPFFRAKSRSRPFSFYEVLFHSRIFRHGGGSGLGRSVPDDL
jgi:hypothetical protein